MVAAVGLGEGGLLLGADAADHGRAQVLGPLAEDQADPTGGRVDQDGIALLYLVGAVDQVVGGRPLQHHGRGLAVVDGVGKRHQTPGAHDALLGVGAEAHGVCHPVAGLEAADVGAHLLDDAGRLHADDRRQVLDRIKPAAVVDVDEVEADGGLAEAHLAGPRGPHLHVLVLERLRPAGLVDANGLGHGSPPGMVMC